MYLQSPATHIIDESIDVKVFQLRLRQLADRIFHFERHFRHFDAVHQLLQLRIDLKTFWVRENVGDVEVVSQLEHLERRSKPSARVSSVKTEFSYFVNWLVAMARVNDLRDAQRLGVNVPGSSTSAVEQRIEVHRAVQVREHLIAVRIAVGRESTWVKARSAEARELYLLERNADAAVEQQPAEEYHQADDQQNGGGQEDHRDAAANEKAFRVSLASLRWSGRRSLQNEESRSGALVAAVVAVAVGPLAADAAQEPAHHAHQHQQQHRADAQQPVVAVDVVLLDVRVGLPEVVLGRAGRVRDLVERSLDLVRNVPHGGARAPDRVRHIRNVVVNGFVDVLADPIQFVLLLRNRVDLLVRNQFVHVADERRDVGQLNWTKNCVRIGGFFSNRLVKHSMQKTKSN